jgi:hypothetical protein
MLVCFHFSDNDCVLPAVGILNQLLRTQFSKRKTKEWSGKLLYQTEQNELLLYDAPIKAQKIFCDIKIDSLVTVTQLKNGNIIVLCTANIYELDVTGRIIRYTKSHYAEGVLVELDNGNLFFNSCDRVFLLDQKTFTITEHLIGRDLFDAFQHRDGRVFALFENEIFILDTSLRVLQQITRPTTNYYSFAPYNNNSIVYCDYDGGYDLFMEILNLDTSLFAFCRSNVVNKIDQPNFAMQYVSFCVSGEGNAVTKEQLSSYLSQQLRKAKRKEWTGELLYLDLDVDNKLLLYNVYKREFRTFTQIPPEDDTFFPTLQLTNGNILFAAPGSTYIIDVKKEKIIMQIKMSEFSAHKALELVDGNILLAESSNFIPIRHRITIYNRYSGKRIRAAPQQSLVSNLFQYPDERICALLDSEIVLFNSQLNKISAIPQKIEYIVSFSPFGRNSVLLCGGYNKCRLIEVDLTSGQVLRARTLDIESDNYKLIKLKNGKMLISPKMQIYKDLSLEFTLPARKNGEYHTLIELDSRTIMYATETSIVYCDTETGQILSRKDGLPALNLLCIILN